MPDLRAIDALLPYARNSRVHSPEQVAQIAASIDEFGFVGAIVARDGTIAKGHGTLAACRLLLDQGKTIHPAPGRAAGAKAFPAGKVPFQDCTGWTDAQFRAFVIADNRLAESADWDRDLLAIELADLGDMGFNLDLLGFDAGELDDMLSGDQDQQDPGADTEPQIDRAEELREKWGVVTGQLWALGEHRLLCGDSTKAEDVARVMAGDRADLCFTSPPYGQQRDYRDGGAVTDWDALMQGVFGNLPMADDGQVLVNLGLIHRDNEWIPYWDGWVEWMRGQGWRRFGLYCWDQGAGMCGDWAGRFAPSFEMVFHFNKCAKNPYKWVEKQEENITVHKGKGSRDTDGKVKSRTNPELSMQKTKIPDSVIRVNRVSNAPEDHPAMFPVALAAFAQQSWPGICFEPFSGSGTTIIAGENLGRRVRAVEISGAYVAVALQRWADHTGLTPVLLP